MSKFTTSSATIFFAVLLLSRFAMTEEFNDIDEELLAEITEEIVGAPEGELTLKDADGDVAMKLEKGSVTSIEVETPSSPSPPKSPVPLDDDFECPPVSAVDQVHLANAEMATQKILAESCHGFGIRGNNFSDQFNKRLFSGLKFGLIGKNANTTEQDVFLGKRMAEVLLSRHENLSVDCSSIIECKQSPSSCRKDCELFYEITNSSDGAVFKLKGGCVNSEEDMNRALKEIICLSGTKGPIAHNTELIDKCIGRRVFTNPTLLARNLKNQLSAPVTQSVTKVESTVRQAQAAARAAGTGFRPFINSPAGTPFRTAIIGAMRATQRGFQAAQFVSRTVAKSWVREGNSFSGRPPVSPSFVNSDRNLQNEGLNRVRDNRIPSMPSPNDIRRSGQANDQANASSDLGRGGAGPVMAAGGVNNSSEVGRGASILSGDSTTARSKPAAIENNRRVDEVIRFAVSRLNLRKPPYKRQEAMEILNYVRDRLKENNVPNPLVLRLGRGRVDFQDPTSTAAGVYEFYFDGNRIAYRKSANN